MHENDGSAQSKRKRRSNAPVRVSGPLLPSQCTQGQWVRYADGRTAKVTCLLGGQPFGRFGEVGGALGELERLPDLSITLP